MLLVGRLLVLRGIQSDLQQLESWDEVLVIPEVQQEGGHDVGIVLDGQLSLSWLSVSGQSSEVKVILQDLKLRNDGFHAEGKD